MLEESRRTESPASYVPRPQRKRLEDRSPRDDIFKGKTVVVFSLPGAFTPTCSSTHVPRYNELAPAFFANGVDRDRVHLGQRRVRDERMGAHARNAATS